MPSFSERRGGMVRGDHSLRPAEGWRRSCPLSVIQEKSRFGRLASGPTGESATSSLIAPGHLVPQGADAHSAKRGGGGRGQICSPTGRRALQERAEARWMVCSPHTGTEGGSCSTTSLVSCCPFAASGSGPDSRTSRAAERSILNLYGVGHPHKQSGRRSRKRVDRRSSLRLADLTGGRRKRTPRAESDNGGQLSSRLPVDPYM
jgi:hypothetical protein